MADSHLNAALIMRFLYADEVGSLLRSGGDRLAGLGLETKTFKGRIYWTGTVTSARKSGFLSGGY